MNCWHCSRPSHGICKFCGRAVCKDHVKERIYIVSVYLKDSEEKAIITKKALYCGFCTPVGEPINLGDQK
jgi:hypothetical protein